MAYGYDPFGNTGYQSVNNPALYGQGGEQIASGYAPGNAPQTATGSGLAGSIPYIKMALDAAQTLSKPGVDQQTAQRFQKMAQSRGLNASIPSAPTFLDKKRQAAANTGDAALNFIPIVGPVASFMASAAHQAKTATAQQKYLKSLFGANPDLFQSGGQQFKSEFVPQRNWAANYANSQPGFMHKSADATMHALGAQGAESFGEGAGQGAKRGALYGTAIAPGFGTVAGGVIGGVLGGIGGAVGGAKAKQAKRQQQIHAANVKKAKAAEMSASVTAQDKRARQGPGGQMMGPQAGPPPQLMAYLQQLLQGRMGPQGPQGPPTNRGY